MSQAASEGASPPTQQPHASRRGRVSVLDTVLILVIITFGALLWWLSRPHKGSDIIVATARRNIAAFSIMHEGDISLTIRPGNKAAAWHTLPTGSLLVLRAVRTGNTIRPDDVLALTGLTMPRRPVIMNVRLRSTVDDQFQPGQQIEVLGTSRHPLRLKGMFLSLQQSGHVAVIAISKTASNRFGATLATIPVTLVRPL